MSIQRLEFTISDVGDQCLSDFILLTENIVKIIGVHINCTRVFDDQEFSDSSRHKSNIHFSSSVNTSTCQIMLCND